MSVTPSPKAARGRQSRKSIAHMPMAEKENASLDSAAMSTIASQLKEKSKKTRSKSIGPGGLDALKEGSGNRGEVEIQVLPIQMDPMVNFHAASKYFCHQVNTQAFLRLLPTETHSKMDDEWPLFTNKEWREPEAVIHREITQPQPCSKCRTATSGGSEVSNAFAQIGLASAVPKPFEAAYIGGSATVGTREGTA